MIRHPRRAPLTAALAILSVLLGPAAPGLPAQAVPPTLFETTGRFAAPDLRESSGVAVSRRHPGLLWTHNDSANEPFLFATDLSGAHLGTYRVRGVPLRDWEDLAAGPCPDLKGACLYIGDTGDNRERRVTVAIYVLPEPDPPPRDRSPVQLPARPLIVTLPGGPQDVEALAIRPNGELLLVTKGRSSPVYVYRISREALARDSATARLTDTLDIVPQMAIGRMVTGAAVSPSGRRLVVRTYTELAFYRVGRRGRLTPDGPRCWLGPREPQGEAVDFLDEDTLVLTSEASEGRRGTISRVRCPRDAPPGPRRR